MRLFGNEYENQFINFINSDYCLILRQLKLYENFDKYNFDDSKELKTNRSEEIFDHHSIWNEFDTCG